MKYSVVLAALMSGVAMMATAASAETTKSPTEAVKFDDCMSMETHARAGDKGCQAVMAKMKVSNSDMDKMKSCEGRPSVDVNKDSDCQTMMKKHPDLVRGHGRLDMDTEVNTPKPGNNGAPAPAKPPVN